MYSTARLYHCCRCQAQVIICSVCDRGHRYCTRGCAEIARLASLKRASKKYLSTRTGRFNNAGRQKRYRARQKQKVTHQCSPQVSSHDVLKNKRTGSEKAEQQDQMMGDIRCHHCGAVCDPFLRQDFIHHSRFLRLFRKQSACEGRPWS